MSKTKHTPGTWEADLVAPMRSEPAHYVIEVRMPEVARDGRIADTLNCDHLLTIEEQRANAYLIAAAPEMLAILERLRTAFRPDSDVSVEIDALIAKAKGGSS